METNKKQKNKGGRPPKISEEIITRLCRSIRMGNWNDTACAFAGINRDTLNVWLKRGEKESIRLSKSSRAKENANEILYLLLYNSYDKALAEAEILGVALIQKAARGGAEVSEIKETFDIATGLVKERTTKKSQMQPQWTAQAWILERRYPERWGKRLEISRGDGEGPEKKFTPEEYMQKCREVAAKMLSFDPTKKPDGDK